MRLPDLQRIARMAMARCTRVAKFEEVQRHYINIYQSNFFVMLYKIFPPLTYVTFEFNLKVLNTSSFH